MSETATIGTQLLRMGAVVEAAPECAPHEYAAWLDHQRWRLWTMAGLSQRPFRSRETE